MSAPSDRASSRSRRSVTLGRFPGFRATVNVPASLQIGGFRGNSNFNTNVQSLNYDDLFVWAPRLEEAIAQIPEVQDVSDNKCVAAIPSGTLTNFKIPNVSDITKTVKVLATSPELPFGGLVASPTVPGKVVSAVTSVFTDSAALDQLKGLVVADSLVAATNDDFSTTLKAFQAGKITKR